MLSLNAKDQKQGALGAGSMATLNCIWRKRFLKEMPPARSDSIVSNGGQKISYHTKFTLQNGNLR